MTYQPVKQFHFGTISASRNSTSSTLRKYAFNTLTGGTLQTPRSNTDANLKTDIKKAQKLIDKLIEENKVRYTLIIYTKY